ncbi:hypothetical protein QQZ08_009750 [Neonectria magnoliae]|uniref:Uncharacterized protein n=1 Tax=Neonectria magnoliae TaxID=2732573 RepID=A0ABR1HL38_9HYPO
MKTRQTARLLRSLLLAVQNQANEESSQFDWDPITFGFTVPIAILATLFALLTIFQAIAAAGKGRRRSNHLAIGTWSARTTRKWSWHEMSFQFTARTPVLRADIIPMHPRPPFIWTHNPFSATWIGFLDQIGLGQSVVIEDSLRETAADYLPDDLLAVPAYSEVGFIVASLAAAGASWKVGAESLYPVITGHDFQFDFRQHPNLGTVGAYSKYTNTSPRSPSVEALNEAILHDCGSRKI